LSATYHGEYQSIRINQYSNPAISEDEIISVIYKNEIKEQGYYKNEEDNKLYDRRHKEINVLHGDIVDERGTIITNTKEFRISWEYILNKDNEVVQINEKGFLFSEKGVLSEKQVNPVGSVLDEKIELEGSDKAKSVVLGATKTNALVLEADKTISDFKSLDRLAGLSKKQQVASIQRLPVFDEQQEYANVTTSTSITRSILNAGNNRYNVNGSMSEDLNKILGLDLQQIAPENLQYKAIPRFYEPDYTDEASPERRSDFRKTIYWNPSIQTNDKGKAALVYYNSDEVTTFRVILEGNSATGQLAHQEHTYYTALPFNIITKIPSVLSFGDTVRMPVVLKNNSAKEIVGQLEFDLPEFLNLLEIPVKDIRIPADSQQVVYLSYQVGFEVAAGQIYVGFKSKGFNDFVTKEVKTSPKGFPVDFAMAGQYLEQTDTFTIQDAYEGSLKSSLTFYPTILEGLMEGVESILRSPSGCFEQVSSSNYPNILALQLMEQTGEMKGDIRAKALNYLETGYNKLAGYEINGGGFEWYGRAPAHEGLTAYGLVQFKDMQAVYSGVNPSMIERTQAYLLSRRDGKGGFNQNVGKYGFSGNKPALFNAYITWALSEVNTKGIQQEVEAMTKEAIASEDLYRMSLAALTHFNLGNEERGNNLLKSIQEMIQKVGLEQVRAESTVTYSYGNALNIETLSFAALAMLKSEQRDEGLLIKMVEYLLSKRQYGRFGSTQSTVMALKALSAYNSSVMKQQEDKSIKVLINGATVWETSYLKDQKGSLKIDSLHQYFVAGQNIVSIKFEAATQGLPYNFDVAWTAQTPQSSAQCPLVLTSSFDKIAAEMGETVRLEIAVQNTKTEALPSTMALIGIPAGLSVQAWQLKDLQEKQAFAFYELKDNYLILYYRELDGQETKRLSLDLKTEVPGHYTAAANTTYLYYGEEDKYWSEGSTVRIK
jgi:hypothetical protein